MPLIEAALAFAITMLALSLIVSSFVEIIHRFFKMREKGLQFMLGQLFDQVLVKYLQPLAQAELTKPAMQGKTIQDAYAALRAGFVERMTANRAPVGLQADPRLSAVPAANAAPVAPVVAGVPAGQANAVVQANAAAAALPGAAAVIRKAAPSWRPGNLWGGQHVTSLAPTEFMERLGCLDIGAAIKARATAAGGNAADTLDAILKDIAQKFDGFGGDAAAYFEGRARFISVAIAIVLAFVVHVDAVDLFHTYLSDPNARAKVIEQSQAMTAQYRAAKEATEAMTRLVPDASANTDVKPQVVKLEKDWKDAVDNVNKTVTQYSGLGVPLGWTPERFKDADMMEWIWFCPANRPDGSVRFWSPYCEHDQRTVLLEIPSVWWVLFHLLLGGLLIGLGSPFWYDAITALTNIRSSAQGLTNAAAPVPPQAPGADRAQPVTPVGAFQASSTAANVAG